jgi:hypothetical protein
MKFLSLLLVLVSFSTVQAIPSRVNRPQLRCAEKASEALKKNRKQYSVFVTTLEELKAPKGWDRASKVRVSILSRDPRGGMFSQARPSFVAIAKSEDVMYRINAPKDGFRMSLYLDELGETTVNLSNVRGDIRMNCGGSEH